MLSQPARDPVHDISPDFRLLGKMRRAWIDHHLHLASPPLEGGIKFSSLRYMHSAVIRAVKDERRCHRIAHIQNRRSPAEQVGALPDFTLEVRRNIVRDIRGPRVAEEVRDSRAHDGRAEPSRSGDHGRGQEPPASALASSVEYDCIVCACRTRCRPFRRKGTCRMVFPEPARPPSDHGFGLDEHRHPNAWCSRVARLRRHARSAVGLRCP